MSNIVSTDPVADMLTRIRNAMAVRSGRNRAAAPNLKRSGCPTPAKKQNYPDGAMVTGFSARPALVVTINHAGEKCSHYQIKSLPAKGRRVYANAQEIPPVVMCAAVVSLTVLDLQVGKDDRQRCQERGHRRRSNLQRIIKEHRNSRHESNRKTTDRNPERRDNHC